MTEKAQLTESTWHAIVSLLSPAYPDLTCETLKKALDDTTHERLEYVGTKDACRILSCTVQTLCRWEKLGYIRARRPSTRKVLYSLEDIKKKIGV